MEEDEISGRLGFPITASTSTACDSEQTSCTGGCDENTALLEGPSVCRPSLSFYRPQGIASTNTPPTGSIPTNPSPISDSIRRARSSSQPRLLRLLLLLILTLSTAGASDCTALKAHFAAFGEETTGLPDRPLDQDTVAHCPSRSCCSGAVESRLSSEAGAEFKSRLQDQLLQLSAALETRTSALDRYFRELISTSRKDLHSMFSRTYGIFYHQNAQVFTQLYDSLSKYYLSGSGSPSSILTSFWEQLFVRMFKILNPQYSLGQRYAECMTPMLQHLKPFGNVPAKLGTSVERAFQTSRALVQGLSAAKEAVQRLMKNWEPDDECQSALTIASRCGLCAGEAQGLKPCHGLCLDTLNICLHQLHLLQPEWDNFTQGVEKLGKRVEGPYSLRAVMTGMDVKLSEAVMTFQDNNTLISSKVTMGCDPLKLGEKETALFRAKRQIGPIDRLRMQHSQNGGESSELSKLLSQLRAEVRKAQGFWTRLPSDLCHDPTLAAPPSEISGCWNGSEKGRYTPAENTTTPTPTPNPGTLDHILRLRIANTRLAEPLQDDRRQTMDFARSRFPSASRSVLPEPPALVDIDEGSGSGDYAGVGESPDLEEAPRTPAPIPFESDDEDLQSMSVVEGSGSSEVEGSGLPPPHVISWEGSHRQPAPPPSVPEEEPWPAPKEEIWHEEEDEESWPSPPDWPLPVFPPPSTASVTPPVTTTRARVEDWSDEYYDQNGQPYENPPILLAKGAGAPALSLLLLLIAAGLL